MEEQCSRKDRERELFLEKKLLEELWAEKFFKTRIKRKRHLHKKVEEEKF